MFLERKKTNKLAHVISMIHQRGTKKRSVIVENGVYSMEIQFQVHQGDFNLSKKVKRPYLQVVSQIQSTQDCRKMKVKLAFATHIT